MSPSVEVAALHEAPLGVLRGDRSMSSKRAYLPELTGIRMIGIYNVYLTHYNCFSADLLDGIPYKAAKQPFGLMMFFCLSGFMIYYRYGDGLTRVTGPWLVRYLQNRFARIYPVYFICLTTLYVSRWLASGDVYLAFPQRQPGDPLAWLEAWWPELARWSPTVATYTLTQALFEEWKFLGFPQGWSLTVEETFYLSAPLIFLVARRWSVWLPGAAIMLLGVLLAATPGSPYQGRSAFLFSYTLCGMIPAFCVGIQLSKWSLRWGIYDRPRRKRPLLTYTSLVLAAAYIAVLTALTPDFNTSGPDQPLGAVLYLFFAPVWIGCLLYGLLTEESLVQRLLSSRVVQLLGSSAYGFYIVHEGFFHFLIQKYLTENYLLRFVLINLIAIAIYKLIEKPANQFIKNLRLTRRERTSA